MKCKYCDIELESYDGIPDTQALFCPNFCPHEVYIRPINICEHKNIRLSLQTINDGHTIVRNQCNNCDAFIGKQISKSKVDINNLPNGTIKFLNYEKKQNIITHKSSTFHRKYLAKTKEYFENRKNQWYKEYKEYLKSPEWKVKREKVLKRDNYICQGCLEKEATQVHHLSYKHIKNEPLFELVSICKECHDIVSKTDRELLLGKNKY